MSRKNLKKNKHNIIISSLLMLPKGDRTDVNKASSSAFENIYKDVGVWLEENCWDFGFIIRYPKGKEHITGYIYEPWHIRYVGKDYAIKIKESALTLEEYLGITSEYEN